MTVFGLAIVAGLIGFGAPAHAEHADRPPADDGLDDRLLTIDDMPNGWAVDPSWRFDTQREVCDNGVRVGLGDLAGFGSPRAQVALTAGMFDYVVHVVSRHADSESAAEVIESMRRGVANCSTVTESNGATTIYSEMSFPDIGDDETYALRVVTDSFPISAVAVVARVDDVLVVNLGVGEGAELGLVEELVAVAVDRVG